MRVASITIVVSMLAGAAVAQTAPRLVAPALQGRFECYQPNRAAKTCKSLSTYSIDASGKVTNIVQVAVADNPIIVINDASEVTVMEDRMCGVITEDDLNKSTFTVGGAPATTAVNERLRKIVIENRKGILGKKICSIYRKQGDDYLVSAEVDGQPVPNADQVMTWVSASDGFQLRP